jgi:lipoate synthase
MRLIPKAVPESPAWVSITEAIRRNNAEKNLYVSPEDVRILKQALALLMSCDIDNHEIETINRLTSVLEHLNYDHHA